MKFEEMRELTDDCEPCIIMLRYAQRQFGDIVWALVTEADDEAEHTCWAMCYDDGDDKARVVHMAAYGGVKYKDEWTTRKEFESTMIEALIDFPIPSDVTIGFVDIHMITVGEHRNAVRVCINPFGNN